MHRLLLALCLLALLGAGAATAEEPADAASDDDDSAEPTGDDDDSAEPIGDDDDSAASVALPSQPVRVVAPVPEVLDAPTPEYPQAALDAGVRRYVHFSSVHAFAHDPYDQPLDERRARPGPSHPAYDRSKAEGEARVQAVVAQGLEAVIVNPTGIIGPADPRPSRMGQVFLDLARRKMPALLDGGFDWVDVRDVVAGAIGALEHGRAGRATSSVVTGTPSPTWPPSPRRSRG